jgi:hypothetical protein
LRSAGSRRKGSGIVEAFVKERPMKIRLFTAPALAIGLSALLALAAQSEDRHFETGSFTLKPGDTADLTVDRIPLAFLRVWAHPFGNRAINITVAGQSYSVSVGTRIDLKSPFTRMKAATTGSALAEKKRCDLEIEDFDNPKEGTPQVTFRLDCA